MQYDVFLFTTTCGNTPTTPFPDRPPLMVKDTLFVVKVERTISGFGKVLNKNVIARKWQSLSRRSNPPKRFQSSIIKLLQHKVLNERYLSRGCFDYTSFRSTWQNQMLLIAVHLTTFRFLLYKQSTPLTMRGGRSGKGAVGVLPKSAYVENGYTIFAILVIIVRSLRPAEPFRGIATSLRFLAMT